MITKTINIIFDENDIQEKSIINLNLSDEQYKNLILIGFNNIKLTQEVIPQNITHIFDKNLLKLQEENLELIKKYEIKDNQFNDILNQNIELNYKYEQLKKTNETLYIDISNQVQNNMKTIYDNIQNIYQNNIDIINKNKDNEINILLNTIQEYKENYDNLLIKYETLFKDIHNGSIKNLEDKLKEKDFEINQLKNSNVVKGEIGENMILENLQNYYPSNIISNKSKTSHSCDIHMTLNSNNKTIVFESKYKKFIDLNDINKFYNDMITLPDDIIGGVFISILNKNIPGKGDVHIEIIPQNNKLIMFLGFNNENDFQYYFIKHVSLFIKLVNFHNNQINQTIDIKNILEEINFLNDNIQKQKSRLDDFKNKYIKYFNDTENDINSLLNRISNILNKYNFSTINSETNKNKQPKYNCDICFKSFTNKKEFTKHQRENCK